MKLPATISPAALLHAPGCCPACREPLAVLEWQAIEIDWCTRCNGIWLDDREAEWILGESGTSVARLRELLAGAPRFAGSAAKSSTPPPARRCPRCLRGLEARAVSVAGAPATATSPEGIVVLDCCPAQHGWWFDAGELGALLDAARSGPASGAGAPSLADESLANWLGAIFRAEHPNPPPPDGGH